MARTAAKAGIHVALFYIGVLAFAALVQFIPALGRMAWEYVTHFG